MITRRAALRAIPAISTMAVLPTAAVASDATPEADFIRAALVYRAALIKKSAAWNFYLTQPRCTPISDPSPAYDAWWEAKLECDEAESLFHVQCVAGIETHPSEITGRGVRVADILKTI